MTKTLAIDPIKEAQALTTLCENWAIVADEDQLFLVDFAEGQTSLFEAFDALLEAQLEDAAHVVALSAAIERLEGRKARFAKRIETSRAVIEQAIAIAGIEVKITRPIATLSMSRRTPKVEVITEADVPSRFWKTGEPTLDKKALGEELKARAAALAALADITDPDAKAEAIQVLPPDIPGAVLSNAAPTLSVRFT